MSIARDLANTMGNPVIDADRGAYYLGSTGPDMHIMSRTDRISSHYFDLECIEGQDSRASFFQTHCEMSDVAKLDGMTAAFVAGYLTHLVIDEVWITDIYRPFFGPASSLHGDAWANVLDRILQYDMDLQRRIDRPAMDEILRALAAAGPLRVSFMESEMLMHWRDVIVGLVSRPPTWDGFGRTASRFLAIAGVSAEEQVDDFMETLPSLLEETKAHVGSERIEDFLNNAHAVAMRTLEEYLE
jgi:hypothetical protein